MYNGPGKVRAKAHELVADLVSKLVVLGRVSGIREKKGDATPVFLAQFDLGEIGIAIETDWNRMLPQSLVRFLALNHGRVRLLPGTLYGLHCQSSFRFWRGWECRCPARCAVPVWFYRKPES